MPDVSTLHSTAGTTGTQATGAVGRYTAAVTSPVVSTFENAAVHVNLDADTDTDDIGATLVSPAGSRVTLASENSENYKEGDFLGTTFTDDAGLSNPPGTGDDVEVHNGGTFAPAQPLASLRGENPSGTWTLEVVGEDGPVTVGDWSLDLGVASCGTETRLTASPAAANVVTGGTVAYAVTARNLRSAPAYGAAVTVAPGAGGTLVSVAASQGTCSAGTCALGALEPGAAASVVFLVKAGAPGTLKPTAVLSQSVGDASPADNAVAFATTVDPGATPADTTKPGIVMTLGDATLKQVATKGLKVLAGGTEKGKLKLTLKVSGKTAKALGVPKKLGKATARFTKAGTVKVTVKVAKKYRKALAGSNKPVKLIVKATLTDTAGNVGKGSAHGTYRR